MVTKTNIVDKMFTKALKLCLNEVRLNETSATERVYYWKWILNG